MVPARPSRGPGEFQGTLENVDVENVPGVGHLTIDKNQIMQQKVIGAIDAVVFSSRAMASARRGRSSRQSRRHRCGKATDDQRS